MTIKNLIKHAQRGFFLSCLLTTLSVTSIASVYAQNQQTSEQQQFNFATTKTDKRKNKRAVSKERTKNSNRKSKKHGKVIRKLYGQSFNEEVHPFTYGLKDVGVTGKTLTTHDETIWEISPNSASTAKTWDNSSQIVIKLNHSWFSSYKYCLYNVSKRNYVEANLSQGPFQKYAIYINYIDRNSQTIELTSGTIWSISRSAVDNDRTRQLLQWKEGQAVLIGERNTWYGSDYMLINLNENNYIEADFMRYLNQFR